MSFDVFNGDKKELKTHVKYINVYAVHSCKNEGGRGSCLECVTTSCMQVVLELVMETIL